MRYHVCRARLHHVVTDLPFKVGEQTIVILKGLPVLQCESCRGFLIDNPAMERVESALAKADADVEPGILRYAAHGVNTEEVTSDSY